jgi:hypothetical protein
MLPPEGNVIPLTGNYSAGSGSSGRNYSQSSGLARPSAGYTYYRSIEKDGNTKGYWCNCPKEGYVRTEAGHLYKDAGANKKIYHALEFIPSDMEYTVLGVTMGTPPANTNSSIPSVDDLLDDDYPPFDLGAVRDEDLLEEKSVMEETDSSGPAPVDQRLRYARLVHNMFNCTVTSRLQLLADLIGMGDEELEGFISEDVVDTHTAMCELIEMILEMNDELFKVDPTNSKILDINTIMELGDTDNHRKAMQLITDARREEYKKKLAEKNGETFDPVAEETQKEVA